ncbi:MAG: DoxX family protein [Siphonobacter sp.]
MSTIKHTAHWNGGHHFMWIDALRYTLGIFLFFKGLSFITDFEGMVAFKHSLPVFWSDTIVYYIVCFQIFGGVMLAVGLQSHVISALQIPILLGAIFFRNPFEELHYLNSEVWLAILTLILLVFYMSYGAKKQTLDEWLIS